MKKKLIYYVYMIKCSDETYYTGVTNDVVRRFKEHQSNLHPESYTYSRQPLELVFVEKFKYINDAISREKQIKRWSQKKKEAIIILDLDLLKQLSKKDFS